MLDLVGSGRDASPNAAIHVEDESDVRFCRIAPQCEAGCGDAWWISLSFVLLLLGFFLLLARWFVRFAAARFHVFRLNRHELIKDLLEPFLLGFVVWIRTLPLAISFLVGGHGNVVKLAVLVKTEAFVSDKISFTVVDQDVVPIDAFPAK